MVPPMGSMTQQPAQRERDTHWRDGAACLGADPDLFQSAHGQLTVANKRAITGWCDQCPVRADCLHAAESLGNVSGVWGGRLFVARVHRSSS